MFQRLYSVGIVFGRCVQHEMILKITRSKNNKTCIKCAFKEERKSCKHEIDGKKCISYHELTNLTALVFNVF